ncbi:MAG: hypothetical protein ACOYL6_08155 [Bacteriovoracaceae bacterium]
MQPNQLKDLQEKWRRLSEESNFLEGQERPSIEQDLKANLDWKRALPAKRSSPPFLENKDFQAALNTLEKNISTLFEGSAFSPLYQLGSQNPQDLVASIVALSSTLKSFSQSFNQSFHFEEDIEIVESHLKFSASDQGELVLRLESSQKALKQLIQLAQNYFADLQSRSKLIQELNSSGYSSNEGAFFKLKFHYNLSVLEQKTKSQDKRIDA